MKTDEETRNEIPDAEQAEELRQASNAGPSMPPMPPRAPADGPIALRRNSNDHLVLKVTHAEVEREVVLGEYNAWRAFGLLALFLGIPLPEHIGKAIQLAGPGEPLPEFTVGYNNTGTALGDRVARNLAMQKLVDAGIVKEHK